MTRRFTAWFLTFACTLLLVVACGGKRDDNNTVPTPTPSPVAMVTTLTYAQVALASSQSTAFIGSELVAMAFSLANTAGPNDVNLISIAFTSSGTIDESLFTGRLRIVQDDNQNGFADGVEPTVATVPSSAITVNNGPVTATLGVQTSIPVGTTRRFVVLLETAPAGAASISFVGSTVGLRVDASTDIVARDTTATTVQAGIAGTFPAPTLHTSVALILNEHLLISEVCLSPTVGEFIEIFNPTHQTVQLANVYLSDATSQTPAPGRFYWRLPTGAANAESGTAGDFLVRFPAAASIPPGGFYVVALDGVDFRARYGVTPNASLRDVSAGAEPLMLRPTGAAAVTATTELLEAGEVLTLFMWDGATDLVSDLDMLNWVDQTHTTSKTGQSVDGPDAGTAATLFNGEMPTNTQDFVRTVPATATPSNSMTRISFTEMGEKQTGGNGILTAGRVVQHDETSEPVDTTFMTATASPGAP